MWFILSSVSFKFIGRGQETPRARDRCCDMNFECGGYFPEKFSREPAPGELVRDTKFLYWIIDTIEQSSGSWTVDSVFDYNGQWLKVAWKNKVWHTLRRDCAADTETGSAGTWKTTAIWTTRVRETIQCILRRRQIQSAASLQRNA